MKTLDLSGSPYEIGFNHGKYAKKEVDYSLDSYEKLFYEGTNISWKQAKELAKRHLPSIEKTNTHLIEEMEGLAKGASVEFEDILTLNTRSEIALTQNKTDGCTSVAVMPPISEKTILAQTWDWRSAQSRSLIMTRIKQDNCPTIHMVTEGGIIGKIGMNSKGLGVCLNALRANVKSNKLPIHLGLREILNSKNIHEAENKVIDGKLGSSANFMIAQDNKQVRQAMNLEISPEKYDKRETKSSYLYHSNHFCSNLLNANIGVENMNIVESSHERINRMGDLIKQFTSKNKMITENNIYTWLSDHANGANSICQHKTKGISDYIDTITAFAVIMDLPNKSMHLIDGQPCQPIEELHFNL